MEKVVRRPLFTRLFDDPTAFRPDAHSVYLYGVFEERSQLVETWRADTTEVSFIRIEELERPLVRINDAGASEFSTRQKDEIVSFLNKFVGRLIYIDITGLSHHVWAPFVRVAIDIGIPFRVVYVEPGDYTFSRNPIRGEIFDLSLKYEGISPLPMFTTVFSSDTEDVCFIPLLGFEGARFAYVMEKTEPAGGKTVPIIGVPGFRIEYPFYAYSGNEPKLTESRAWRRVHYARANCPFSLFYVLEDIFAKYPEHLLKIAPIGTKPHALGAIIKCATTERQTEIIYDNPKRKPDRTSGTLNCLVYSVSDFLSGYQECPESA